MSASRGNYFYRELPGLSSDYKDNSFEFQFSSRHIKLSVVGGDLEYSLVGADNSKIDGTVKPTDGVLPFDGLEANRISLRQKSGAITLVRLWAYK